MQRITITLFILIALLRCSAQAQGVVVVNDPLQGKTIGKIEGAGEFVTGGGWRGAGGLIAFDAGRQIEHGYFEATVRSAAFPPKGADKSHMFSGWEGDAFDPGKEPGSFWHWRTGTQDVIKALAAPDGGGTREERGFGRAVYAKYNDGQAHRFSVAWAGGAIEFALDGELIQSFKFHRMSIRYVTVGQERGGAGAKLVDPAPIVANVKLVDLGAPLPISPAIEAEVAQRSLFEKSFEHAGSYQNPYAQVTALATLTRWNGNGSLTLPLFWDGGKTWRLRFAPNAPGRWDYRIESNDPALDGKAGALLCVASNNRGSVVAHGEFRYEKREAFWPLGDTNWAAFQTDEKRKLNRQTVEHYVDVRAAQGFNLLQTNLLGEAVNEGGAAFTDYAGERLNPAYWQEVERRVLMMNRKNMLVLLTLAGQGNAKSKDKSWLDFPHNAARQRYVDYIAARFSAFNVAFSVASEWSGSAKLVNGLAARLAERDPHERMIVVHPAFRSGAGKFDHGSAKLFANQSWMSLADFRNDYDNLHEGALAARDEDGKLRLQAGYGVYLLDQDGDGRADFHNSRTLDEMRHATWDVVMAGSPVITAFASTYDGGRGYPGGFDVDDARMTEWATQLGHLRRFFLEILPRENMRGGWRWLRVFDPVGQRRADEYITALVARAPDVVTTLSDGRTVTGPPQRAYWMMAKEGFGWTAAVYVRGYAGEYTVRPFDAKFPDHSQEPTPVYAIRLFNPRTGEVKNLAEHTGREPIRLTPPDAQDWVFAIRRMNPWTPKDFTPDR